MPRAEHGAYLLVLEDLKKRKRLLEGLILELERFLASDASESDVSEMTADDYTGTDFRAAVEAVKRSVVHDVARHSQMDHLGMDVRPGRFQRWTLSNSIMWILDISENGRSNAEIITCLNDGGFEFRSQNVAVAVAQCLKRLSDKAMVRRLSRGKWARAEAEETVD